MLAVALELRNCVTEHKLERLGNANHNAERSGDSECDWNGLQHRNTISQPLIDVLGFGDAVVFGHRFGVWHEVGIASAQPVSIRHS